MYHIFTGVTRDGDVKTILVDEDELKTSKPILRE